MSMCQWIVNNRIILKDEYSKTHGNYRHIKSRADLLRVYGDNSYRYSGIDNRILHLINRSIDQFILEAFDYTYQCCTIFDGNLFK